MISILFPHIDSWLLEHTMDGRQTLANIDSIFGHQQYKFMYDYLQVASHTLTRCILLYSNIQN